MSDGINVDQSRAPWQPPPPGEPPGSRDDRTSALLSGLVGGAVGAVLATAVTLAVVAGTGMLEGSGSSVRAPLVETSGDAGEGVIPAVAKAVTPSVVRVDVLPEEGLGAAPPRSALGSGVIYRSDGYILTNHHVVVEAADLRVRLASGDVLEASVVGNDPLNDLAVLEVDRDGLPAVNLRDTDEEPLAVGETVVAIGSPFGLDASVTAGVISALNRDITVPDQQRGGLVIPAVIQTDAAINPGNSGGALVDTSGRVIGINTAIFSQSGGSQGVGFAIPVSQAVASAEELVEHGEVDYPFLGVSGTDLTPEVAERFDLPLDGGALIETVTEDSAAAEAGVEPNDIVTAIDGEPITSMSDLVVAVRQHDPGDTVTITLVRDGEEQRVEVTLGERPEDLGG